MSDMGTPERRAKQKSTHARSPGTSFEFPECKIPNLEIPAGIRELVERAAAQAKDNCEKVRMATEEMSEVAGATFATAARSTTEYGLKVLEMTRVNSTAAFEFMGKLMSVTSPAEVVELASVHARQQFEASSRQNKELLALAGKMASESVEPIKTSMSKAFARNA